MDLRAFDFEEFSNPFDGVTHHGTADMVGVVVTGQYPGQLHAVLIEDVKMSLTP